MAPGERMNQIYEKFLKREDNSMWDLELQDLGDNKIKILLQTNDGYLRGRSVMSIVRDRVISIDEDDHIEDLSQVPNLL